MDAYHATAIHRLHSIWLSFRNLPHWLQGWVFLILMPLNAPALWGFTLAVFMVNAISLFFDVVDAWCWAQGDRLTLHPDHS